MRITTGLLLTGILGGLSIGSTGGATSSDTVRRELILKGYRFLGDWNAGHVAHAKKISCFAILSGSLSIIDGSCQVDGVLAALTEGDLAPAVQFYLFPSTDDYRHQRESNAIPVSVPAGLRSQIIPLDGLSVTLRGFFTNGVLQVIGIRAPNEKEPNSERSAAP